MRMKLHRSTALGGTINFHVAHDVDDLELCASFPNSDAGRWAAQDWLTRLGDRGDVSVFDDDTGKYLVGSSAELAGA
jgi:hypothetical protein